jgi:Thiol-disulfide isomerase and thioredoxins
MDPVGAFLVVLALVVGAAALGLVWRARTGRVRATRAVSISAGEVGLARFGTRATLVQFSTEYCSPCRATRAMLAPLAAERDGVEHIDVDLTLRPDLADRFRVTQTPTVLLVDAAGTVRGRIGGAPRRHDVIAHIDHLLEEHRV